MMDYDKIGAKRVSDTIRKFVVHCIENNIEAETHFSVQAIREALGYGEQIHVEPHINQNYIRQIARRQIERMGAQMKASVSRHTDAENGDCFTLRMYVCEDVIPIGKLFKPEWLDEFEVNVSRLGDSELMVRDVNEIVRQLKEFALERMGATPLSGE